MTDTQTPELNLKNYMESLLNWIGDNHIQYVEGEWYHKDDVDGDNPIPEKELVEQFVFRNPVEWLDKASPPCASPTTASFESYHVTLEDNRRDESIKLAAEKYANQFCEIEADSMSIDKLLSEFKRQGIDTTNWYGDEGAEKAIVDGVKNLISSPTTAGESKEDVLKKHVTGDDKLVVPFEEYLQYDSTKDILAAMEEYAQSPSASFSLEVVVWANFKIPVKLTHVKIGGMAKLKDGQRGDDRHKLNALGFDLSKYKGFQKEKLLRNCVTPEIGLAIFESALNIYNHNKVEQVGLFSDLKP